MNGAGDVCGVVVHEHDVGGLDGGVGAHGAHGDADVGAGEHGRVVDAVAHEGELALAVGVALGLGEERFHLGHLVLGKQLGVHLVDAECGGDGLGHGRAVAGEHDGLLHAGRPQVGDGAHGAGLHGVGDDDGAQVGAVGGYVEHGARGLDGGEGDMVGRHELAVAHERFASVHDRFHALAAHLADVAHPFGGCGGAAVRSRAGRGGVAVRLRQIRVVVAVRSRVGRQGVAIGPHRLRDGMGGERLGRCGDVGKLGLAYAGGADELGHGEGAVGQGAGLVEHDGLGGA